MQCDGGRFHAAAGDVEDVIARSPEVRRKRAAVDTAAVGAALETLLQLVFELPVPKQSFASSLNELLVDHEIVELAFGATVAGDALMVIGAFVSVDSVHLSRAPSMRYRRRSTVHILPVVSKNGCE